MLNRHSFLLPAVIRFAFTAALVMLILPLYSCGGVSQEPPAPAVPVTLYDDGVYTVELTDRAVPDGDAPHGGTAQLKLKVCNRSDRDFALSTVLGAKAADCTGQKCSFLPACSPPLDGLVPVDGSREGWVCIETPPDGGSLTLELAVNYPEDEWISFEISL